MPKHIAEGVQLTASVEIVMNGGKITGSGTPSADTDGATKGYVDALKVQTKEMWFKMHDSSFGSQGYHRGIYLDGADVYMTFKVPADFNSLTSVATLIIPKTGTGGSGKDIDISSNYGTENELMTQHAESDTASTYTLTEGQIQEIDLSGILTAIAADDIVGIKLVGNTLGGDVLVTGIRFRYT